MRTMKNSNKPRCNGQWTEARYHAFIASALRKSHMKWAPKNEAKRRARVRRGVYVCAHCGDEGPASLPPLKGKKRRRDNVLVDHIEPVVDPAVGFVSWDVYIDRMFVEVDGYQVLCRVCHDMKTAEERDISTERKRREKDETEQNP